MIRPKAMDGILVNRSTTPKPVPVRPTRVTMVSDSLRRPPTPTVSAITPEIETTRPRMPVSTPRTTATQPRESQPQRRSLLRDAANAGVGGSIVNKFHFIILVVAIAVLAILMAVFSRAHVTVEPLIITKDLTIDISAIRTESVTVADKASLEVMASTVSDVETYATGTVRLFNEEPTAQKLRSKTRLADPNGLIYYLPEAGPTIPAASGGVPGTIDVTVTAEKPGESYNQKATDFVFPGWKEVNSKKFTTQYGRSVSDLAGGGRGARAQVDPVELARITEQLTTAVQEKLRIRGTKEIPAEWMVIPGTETLTIDTTPTVTTTESGKATVTLAGTMAARLVHRSQIGEMVAADSTYTSRDVFATGFANPQLSGNQLSGTVSAELAVSRDDIYKIILGANHKNIQQRIADSGLVQSAQIHLYPAWARVFPKTEDRVTIDLQSKIDVFSQTH